jgi:hypothetical protein
MNNEVYLGRLRDDKESVALFEDIINRAGSWVFNIFVEDPSDVEFKGVEWDTLVWVYIKGNFNRYISVEQRKQISNYRHEIKPEAVVVAEIQPKAFDSDVVVLKVTRNDE